MTTFEAVLLPDETKRSMCVELLEEFGASTRRINDKSGEMIHGCLVSPGVHANQSKEPTASLNYKKLTYKCLGCGTGGGFLWFIATCKGISTPQARTWLEEEAGLGGTVLELDAMLKFLDQLHARRVQPEMPTYSERLLHPCFHPYIEDRGIPQAAQEKFKVGWDAQTDRIVLPHFWKGKLVGWQTRRMPQDYWSMQPVEHTPKYLSSPDFPKDTTVFNYVPGPRALVVESMFSVLRHDHALPMVATFGASVTPDQLRRLAKYEEVVLWMDNDPAGWVATLGTPAVRRTSRQEAVEARPGMAETLSRSVQVWVVPSPWMQDAGDLPTEEVIRLEALKVPWTVWEPPKVLYCWNCKSEAHTGPCAP